jgi:hypothetical protein
MIAMRLEDLNGLAVAEAQYDKHADLRPFDLPYQGQWYEQNHKDGEIWVYRQRSWSPTGTVVTDVALLVTPATTPTTPVPPVAQPAVPAAHAGPHASTSTASKSK